MENMETSCSASNKKEKKGKPNRNESEKKRRDTFNYYIKILGTMVPQPPGINKLDKSTILQMTFNTLKMNNVGKCNEVAPFMSGKELGQLIFEGLDGFLFVTSETGEFIYLSDSVRSILGYSVDQLLATSLFDLIHPDDKAIVNEKLFDYGKSVPSFNVEKKEKTNKVCKMRIKQHTARVQSSPPELYVEINCAGMLVEQSKLKDLETQLELKGNGNTGMNFPSDAQRISFGLVAICCLQKPTIVSREVSNQSMPSFTAHLSLDGKFVHLESQSVAIIGHFLTEVIGKSMYHYIHKDDINSVASAHTKLLESGEETSCTYRFQTKGRQWVWLNSKYRLINKDSELHHPDHVESINTLCSHGPGVKEMSTSCTSILNNQSLMNNLVSVKVKKMKEDPCQEIPNPSELTTASLKLVML